MSQQIKLPKIEWVYREHFQLSEIEEDFEIADFQRRLSIAHVNDIYRALQKGKFFGNIIRAVKRQGKKSLVIDGQHTMAALQKCQFELGWKEYPLMFGFCPPEAARIVYRNINMGKPLQVRDHTKAMDTGDVFFFSHLKPYLNYYREKDKMSFTDALFALQYCKRGETHPSGSRIDDYLKDATDEDVRKMGILLGCIRKIETRVQNSPLYRKQVFWNLLRIGYEKHISDNAFTKFVGKCATDRTIINSSKGLRSEKQLTDNYEYMKELLT